MTKTKTFSPRQLINQLKSGKWRKAREILGRGGVDGVSRCCLGVACEMAGVDWEYTIPDIGSDDEVYTDLGVGLPMNIHDKAKFKKAFPWMNLDIQNDLAGLNDTQPGWGAVIDRLGEIDRTLKAK